ESHRRRNPIQGNPFYVRGHQSIEYSEKQTGVAGVNISHQVAIQLGTEKRGCSEEQLSHYRVKSKVLLTPRYSQKGIDHNLKHRHTDAEREEQNQYDGKRRKKSKEQNCHKRQYEPRYYHCLERILLGKHT